MPGEPWEPQLTDVARHIPERTRDTNTPGSDAMLVDFTADTTPTDTQVQQMIDDAAQVVAARLGSLPDVVTQHPELAVALRVFVEWRVAADIEMAYPNRNADIKVYDSLNARAQDAWATVMAALVTDDVGAMAVDPDWSFPDGPAFADQSPASGADFVIGNSKFRGPWVV